MANNSISNILSRMGNGTAPSNQVMRIAQQPKSSVQPVAQNTPKSNPLTPILSRMSGNPDTVSTIRAPQKSYQQRVAEGEAKYQERAAQQEEADAKVRGSFWDILGNAAAMQNSQYLPVDQQLSLAQRQAKAANDFTTGLKESKEASKAIEWNGRQQMVDEYKHLSYEANRARTFHDPKAAELAQQAADLQKEIQRRDVMVGNGERDLHAADRMTSVVGSTAKGIGSGLIEFAADAGQAIGKASVNQQLLSENQFLLDQMLGEDTVARYNQVNAAMNSEEGQRVWNQMYSVADSLGEGAARDLTRAKNGLGALGRAGVDIGVNVLQMGFDAGVGALTGGSSLVPMFARVAGESMREARLEGASLERRLAYGVTKGTIEVATEKMFDGVAKLYGSGAFDDIVEVAIRRAATTDAGKSMLRILAGASGEAIEEVVSSLLDPFADAIKTGKVGKLDAEEMLYSAFIGFCIGFLGSGGNAIAGGNAEANAELRARDAMYAQMQNQPSLRQEVRDMGILSKLQSDPNYYQNLNTNNTDVAMEALSDAGRASELQQAQFASANSQVKAIEEQYGVKHDDGGRFVTRNGQKIYSPTTVQELQVYLLLTQTDMTRAEAETIAKSKAYSDAFARLTGIEMTSDYSQKLAAIQNAFQKAAETQEASGGTETSPDSSEATEGDSGELNNASENGEAQDIAEESPKQPKIGPKHGRDIARQAYAEDTIAQEEARQTSNAEADVENNTFNEDFEAEDMQLQQDAAETTRRAEEAEAKRAADANRPGPIGPKRAAQMDREANAEADQARAEAREAETEAANIEGDFDEDAAAEQYAAEQQAAAEAAAEAERRATYEERRKAGQLTEQEKAEAKSTAEAKRSEKTNKRLTELSNWAKSWAARWQKRHGRNYDPGAKRILHGELAKAIEGFANGTTTAAELSEIYNSLNAEDATADSKYFYEPDVAKNLENLVEAEEKLALAQESGNEDVTQEVDALYRQAEQAISNLQTKLGRLDKLAGIRSSLFGELAMETKVKGHGIRQQIMHFAEMYLKTQSRIDTMFRFFGGFNEQASKEWYKLASRSTDAERRFITTGYNARSFFYLLQSQSPEMAKAWSDLEGGKLKGGVDVPGIGKMSLNYELSLLRTLETSGGITHIAGNGFETAYEPDYYKGRNNNGWGNNAADHNTVDVHVIQQMALPFLKAEDSNHPTAEEWMAARVKALESLREELRADVMASPIGKAAYEASEEAFKYLAREVNKTSVEMFGYEKATNTDYYPLEDASSGTTTKAMGDRLYDMNNPHFLQRRTDSDQALKIKPFAETMMNYIQEASNWAAFANLWSDMQILDKTMNQPNEYPTLAGMVSNSYGNYAKEYLSRWERVISNNRPKTSAANRVLGAIRKNIAQASLTLNPGVALKQTPSYYAAAGVIDMDILIKSRIMTGGPFRTARSYRNNRTVNEVNSRSGIVANRLAGYNTIEQGESLEATRSIGQKVMSKLPKWMTNWITGRDVSTVSNLAVACAEQVKRDNPNLKVGSDEYYDAVTALLEEVVVKSQPIYDPQFRAEMLRSDSELLRSLAMFKTQPSQDFNQLYTAIGEYRAMKNATSKEGKAEAKAAKERLQKTIAGQIVAKAAFSALTMLADLITHRTKKYKWSSKDEEKDPEHREGEWAARKFLTRFIFGTASSAASILWFGDTVAAIAADMVTGTNPFAEDTTEFYSISESTTALINDVVKAGITMAQTIGNPDRNGWQKAKAIKELVAKAASTLGISFQNAYNIVNTIVMYELDNDQTKNFDHNDDFMRSMSNYSQLSDTAIARKTMDRAAISFSKGKLSEAESLLATLNFESNDIISAVASSAKESYINGTLTEKQYRTILKDYCKKKTDDVNKAVEDAGRDIAYNAAKEKNEKGFEAAETLIKAATDKRRDDDRPRDYYVMDSILTSTLTDKEKDVTVAANLSKEYRTNYNILRNAGMSSAKTAELLEAIDKNSTGSIDQDELYEWYLGHKADEKKIAALFNAKGYEKGTLTWTKFIDNKKNMPYDEVKLANENNKKFNQLDEYAKQLQSDSRIIMQKTDADQAIYSKIAEMGLKDEEFDAAVQQYVSSGGRKAYNAARNEGYTPDKTVALIKAIDSYYQPKSPDSQNNGSLSIAEIMAYLKEHPDEETVLESIYYASTTSNKSWEEQKKKAKVK